MVRKRYQLRPILKKIPIKKAAQLRKKSLTARAEDAIIALVKSTQPM
jgi:hypothetical protein